MLAARTQRALADARTAHAIAAEELALADSAKSKRRATERVNVAAAALAIAEQAAAASATPAVAAWKKDVATSGDLFTTMNAVRTSAYAKGLMGLKDSGKVAPKLR